MVGSLESKIIPLKIIGKFLPFDAVISETIIYREFNHIPVPTIIVANLVVSYDRKCCKLWKVMPKIPEGPKLTPNDKFLNFRATIANFNILAD
jgi:hypothetical protein